MARDSEVSRGAVLIGYWESSTLPPPLLKSLDIFNELNSFFFSFIVNIIDFAVCH